MNTKVMIIAALAKLDPSNENHWTTDGQPRIDTVKMIGSLKELTREDITKAAPSFSRSSPLTETDKQAEADATGGVVSEGSTGTTPIVAPAGTLPAATPNTTTTGGDNVQVHSEAAESFAVAGFNGDASLEEQLAFAQERLAELEHAKVQVARAHAEAISEVDRLIDATEKSGAKETTASTIRNYLDGQNRLLEQRAAHNAKLSAIDFDLKTLLPAISPLDASLRGRKRG